MNRNKYPYIPICRRLGIRANVVSVPPPSLKQHLVKSRMYDNKCETGSCPVCVENEGTCKIKGAVYKITCTSCASFYVGETGRPLLTRFKEHLADIQHNDNRTRPWSLHMRLKHAGTAVPVNLSVLCVERNLRRRKIKEAIYIEKLKPDVNVREEMSVAMRFIH